MSSQAAYYSVACDEAVKVIPAAFLFVTILYESQLYAWRSKLKNAQSSSDREQEMSVEIARLKRQPAVGAGVRAILQKAAAYFVKRLK